jgi:phosphonate metabolism-associated iron-containing alcohol dehydrogenase
VSPVPIEFGAGRLAELQSRLRGHRTVILTHRHARDSGLLERLVGMAGAGFVSHTLVGEMPGVQDLERLHAEVWDARFDRIVAAGGGSVIDAAKVVSVEGWRPEQQPAEHVRIVPVLAVPTTAGTGSEVTPWATLWDRDRREKRSLSHPRLHPALALCDPSLTLSMPPALTVSSGLDALAHALESLWSVYGRPDVSVLALRAARRIVQGLPRVLQEPDQLQARTEVMRGALEAGLCCASTRTGIAHALSYSLTLRKGTAHGLACAVFLPSVIDLLEGELAQPLVALFGQEPGEGARRWLASLGVSARLPDLDLDSEDLAALQQTARTHERARNSRVVVERLLDHIRAQLGARGEDGCADRTCS